MLRNTLKVLHILGLVLFLGSIISFIIASELSNDASLDRLLFAREFISTGTVAMTLPGMWLAIISGFGMAFISGQMRQSWVKVKLTLSTIVVLNAHIIIMQAVTKATTLAEQSLQQGVIHSEYHNAYMQESMFGALNVVFIIILVIIGVVKPGKKIETG